MRAVEREAARALHATQGAWLSIGEIVETPEMQNSRTVYDVDSLTELASSIKEHGVLQPLLVRPIQAGETDRYPTMLVNGQPQSPTYVVIAGNRRLKAARMAGLDEVPCSVKVAGDDQSFVLNVVENVQRRELSGRERVRAITLLANLTDVEGRTLGVHAISRRTGLSTATISQWLRIRTKPTLREAVEGERLDIGRAMRLVSVPDDTLDEMIDRASELSQHELGREVAAMNRTPERRQKRIASVNQRRLMHAYRQLMLVDEVDTDLREQLELIRFRVDELLQT
jgi:ParB family chromosome partitioning protein